MPDFADDEKPAMSVLRRQLEDAPCGPPHIDAILRIRGRGARGTSENHRLIAKVRPNHFGDHVVFRRNGSDGGNEESALQEVGIAIDVDRSTDDTLVKAELLLFLKRLSQRNLAGLIMGSGDTTNATFNASSRSQRMIPSRLAQTAERAPATRPSCTRSR